MSDVVYFELNNWFCGRDYPPCDPIKSWVENSQFNNDQWCRENKICVLSGIIDMSENWCITAPVEWVQENFPQLLEGGEFTYNLIVYSRGTEETRTYTNNYNSFRRYPYDDINYTEGQFGWPFLEYEDYNFGSHYYSDDDYDDDDYEE